MLAVSYPLYNNIYVTGILLIQKTPKNWEFLYFYEVIWVMPKYNFLHHHLTH